MAIRTSASAEYQAETEKAEAHRESLARLLSAPHGNQTRKQLAEFLRRQATLIEGEYDQERAAESFTGSTAIHDYSGL